MPETTCWTKSTIGLDTSSTNARCSLLLHLTSVAEVGPADRLVAGELAALPREGDAADLEDGGGVGRAEGQVGVLLDHQDGGPVLPVDGADDVEDLPDDDRRQAQRRLVEEEQLRVEHQRARDRKHLLLATGEGGGDLLAALPDPGEVAHRLLVVGPDLRPIAADVGAHLEVLPDRHLRHRAPTGGHVCDAEPRDLLGLPSGCVPAW